MSNSDIPDRAFGNTAPRDSSSSNGASIIVKDAYKIYKRGKIDVVALRGLNCEFYSGEVTVIMGPSGCGKTTILNMIGGLDRLSSGKILLPKSAWERGQIEKKVSRMGYLPNSEIQELSSPFWDVAQMTNAELEQYRRTKIGFVFQFLNLIPELTAEENIYLPLKLSNRLTKKRKITFRDYWNSLV